MLENDREILIADAYANNPDSQNIIQLGEEIELETEEYSLAGTGLPLFWMFDWSFSSTVFVLCYNRIQRDLFILEGRNEPENIDC